MKVIKKVRAPVRIDFAGGTTDIYPFTHKYGGAVLNAGINRYVKGEMFTTSKNIGLKYKGDVPTSSGLGTSGVMNLVWLALISKVKDKKILAEDVYDLEQSMELVGGKQDQYAGAFGGINLWEFKKDKVIKNEIKLGDNFIKEFESKLVLVYTGKPHFSGDTNKSAIDFLKKRKNIQNLLKLKEIAKKMAKSLVKKDLYEFASLMNQETMERRMLHKSIVGSHLQKYIDKGMKNGAIAAKVCGSGGGGSVLFFTDNRERLEKVFGSKVIQFKFDFKGITWNNSHK